MVGVTFGDDSIIQHDHPQNIYSCRCMNKAECDFHQRMERENAEFRRNCLICNPEPKDSDSEVQ